MNSHYRFAQPTPRTLVVGLFVFVTACNGGPKGPVITPMPEPPAQVEPASRQPVPSAIPVTRLPDVKSVVASMNERYASSWYGTVTFVQKTTVSMASGGELVQTWYEAAQLPGRLRIDTDRASKSGVLYARDSIFRFANGKLAQADTGVNDLLVLGFDVYAQPAPVTEALLRRLGFDLSTTHEDTWQGRPVLVVGAAKGDTTSKQFWVDKERLLFVRMLQHNPRRGQIDVRFDDYVPAGRGWIARRVEQWVNGKRTLIEEYSDIRTDVPLSPDLFDARMWGASKP